MINELRRDARSIDRVRTSTAVHAPGSMQQYGVAGAILGATWFGAAFPLLVNAFVSTASATEAAVYVASGVLFGVISGGTIGAVIGAGTPHPDALPQVGRGK